MSSIVTDRLREGQRWAARIEVFPNRDQVVLGLGQGRQHVSELAKMTDKKIFVIDPRPLDPTFQDQIASNILMRDRVFCGIFSEIFPRLQHSRYQVQLFRPAWEDLESEFLLMRDRLNGRASTENHLISIKDIISEKNEIALLKELVR